LLVFYTKTDSKLWKNNHNFVKGKNAIELGSEAEVADVLAKVREAAELGELDALIKQQAQFGRRVTQKNK
jgi:predicted nicotinamide N-methyase